MNEMCLVCKGMLDPIIISLLLTIYLCVTYLEYNNYLWILLTINLTLGVSNFYKQTFLSFLKQDSKIWREICVSLFLFPFFCDNLTPFLKFFGISKVQHFSSSKLKLERRLFVIYFHFKLVLRYLILICHLVPSEQLTTYILENKLVPRIWCP